MCYSVLVEQDLRRISANFDALIDEAAFLAYDALHHKDPKKFRELASNPRIYPNYFCPVIVARQDRRSIEPQRYRVRPHDSVGEVPTKYNLFNARRDSLEKRATWSGLFMRNHGILIAHKFFEWVTRDAKKQVIAFQARDQEWLPIPVLFDQWSAPDGSESFRSFALITGEPPAEVLAAGHDRCPLVLRPEQIDVWLHPEQHPRAAIHTLLDNTQNLCFDHALAAP